MARLKLTNQRINELLKIVLETFKKDEYNQSRGICYFIDSLRFTHNSEEADALFVWFQNQKPRPRMNYQFAKDETFYGGMWWWFRYECGTKPRIEFLEYLIKKTSN
jgi:hypothetical protein